MMRTKKDTFALGLDEVLDGMAPTERSLRDVPQVMGMLKKLQAEGTQVLCVKTQISPKVARVLLKGNTHNRRTRSRKVKEFSYEMKRGSWLVGQPLMFSQNGILLDGQHRLAAVVASGCTVEFNVLFNMEQEVQVCLDKGAKRTNSDGLVLTGEYHFEDRNFESTLKAAIFGPRERYTITISEDLRTWGTLLRDQIVSVLASSPKVKNLNALIRGTAVRALCEGHDPERVKEFLRVVAYGKDFGKENSAGFLLHQMLRPVKKENKLQGYDLWYAAHKALGVFLEKRVVRRLRPIKEMEVFKNPLVVLGREDLMPAEAGYMDGVTLLKH